MTATTRNSLGTRDHKGAELRNFRVHLYPTVALMNADAGTSTARIAFCAETGRFYFGNSGWVGLTVGSLWGDQVAALPDLPVIAPDGEIRVVLNDGTGAGPTLYMFRASDSTWNKVSDPRIVLKDGTVTLTGLLTFNNPTGVQPTAQGHLTHKFYVDAQDAAMLAAADGAADAKIAAHVALPDPHTQYTTDAEAGVIAGASSAAAIAAHLLAASHLTSGDVNALAAALITLHNSDAAAHSSVVTALANHIANGADPHLAAGYQKALDVANQITSHNTDLAAHNDIRLLIAGLTPGPVPESTARRAEIIGATTGGAFGCPVIQDQVIFNLFHPSTSDSVRPTGVINTPSTPSTVNTTLQFVASNKTVIVDDGTQFAKNDIIKGNTALNAGYFEVFDVIGNVLRLHPAPVDETVGSTGVTKYTPSASVILGGQLDIKRTRSVMYGVTGVTANVSGSGRASLGLIPYYDFHVSGLWPVAGSTINLAGLTNGADDGTYTIFASDPVNKTITLTVTLGADQAAPGGTAAQSVTGPSVNFPTTCATPVDFYLDVADPLKYSSTPKKFMIGTQVSDEQFIVRIEEALLPNTVTGSGTSNKIPKRTGSTTVGDSGLTDDGTSVTSSENIVFSTMTKKIAWNDGSNPECSIASDTNGTMFFKTGGSARIEILTGGRIKVAGTAPVAVDASTIAMGGGELWAAGMIKTTSTADGAITTAGKITAKAAVPGSFADLAAVQAYLASILT